MEVRVEGLHLSYGDREVLSDIEVRLRPGERACLIGPNGAGKSSLLRCLTGLVQPSSGSITLDGSPVGDIDRAAQRPRFDSTPQRRAVDMLRLELHRAAWLRRRGGVDCAAGGEEDTGEGDDGVCLHET